MNRTLPPSGTAPAPSFVVLLLTAGIPLVSTGQPLRAGLTAKEREAPDQQPLHLSRAVDLEPPTADEKTSPLGMLILRDDAPAKTAGHAFATRTAATRELRTRAPGCPCCRELTDPARRDPSLPALPARPPDPATVEMFRRSRRLVDDGHGYVPSAEALGSRLPAALDILREVLREHPDYADALQLYAVLTQLEGESREAERAHRKTIRLNPTASAALHNLREGLYSHALHILEYAMSQAPSHETARLLAWLHRFPESRHLVPARRALELMRTVVREERSPEKRFEDHRYLTELRAEVSSPWAAHRTSAVRCRVDAPWER